MESDEACEYCPICYKSVSVIQIENHVNKCIFLNSIDEHSTLKRKRSSSPTPSEHKQECSKISKANVNNQDPTTRQCSNAYSQALKQKSSNTSIEEMCATPLAVRMQPKSLNDFFGQNHVLGNNTFLRLLLNNNEIPNIILWGPPGCGKTSLANIIKNTCLKNEQQYSYIEICGVNCGIKELQDVFGTAKDKMKSGLKTVLFIDEIHRLNKRQQNALLVQIVNDNIILIGATTENPSFIMSNSFLTYCKVIALEKLDTLHLISIIKKTLSNLNITILDDKNTIRNLYRNDQNGLCIQYSAIEWLAETTDGDARIALNNLQLILQHNSGNKFLTIANIKDGIKKSHLLYDRNGEEHHNIISAMHESIKGYSDNAALYWTARMLAGGEDALFIARRLVRAASEDTGNADPKGLQLAVSIMHACQVMEKPETDVLLAQCAVYLARAPTNKQTITALSLAKEIIKESKVQVPVPLHLCNLPKKIMDELAPEESLKRGTRSFMPVGLENVKFL